MQTLGRTGRTGAAALLGLAVFLLITLTGPAAGAQTESGASSTRLRAINLSASTPGLRVAVDGRIIASEFGYGAAGAYVTLPAGRRHVQFSNGAGTIVVDATPTLLAGHDYTYTLQDLLGDRVAGVLAADDNSPVQKKMVRVRFGNALPNDLSVQALLRGATAHFRATDPAGLSSYQEVPAGTYTLEIATPAGQVLLSVPNIALAPGAAYSLFSTGLNTASTATTAAQTGRVVVVSGGGSQVIGTMIALPSGGASGTFQLVNLVPPSLIAGPASVAIDGQTVLSALGFGGVSSRVSLAAGEHHLQIYGVTGGPPLVDAMIAPLKNSSSLYVLCRLPGNVIGATEVRTANTTAAAGRARVRFGNVFLQGQPLGAALVGASSFTPLAVGSVSGYHDVLAGRYAVQISSGEGTVLVTVPDVVLAAGQDYTLFAVAPGDAAHGAPILALSPTGSQFFGVPVVAAGT